MHQLNLCILVKSVTFSYKVLNHMDGPIQKKKKKLLINSQGCSLQFPRLIRTIIAFVTCIPPKTNCKVIIPSPSLQSAAKDQFQHFDAKEVHITQKYYKVYRKKIVLVIVDSEKVI